MRKIITFILAGGRGERISPLTRDRAKPAVPFGGIYRIIDFTLSNCLNSGIRKIHVLTQYKSHSLQRHLQMGWNIFDPEINEYIDVIPAQMRVGEDWYKGTADAIYQNIYAIENEDPDEVVILAGDHIYKMDYSEMIEFHRSNNADVTLSVVEVEKSKSSSFGIVEADAKGSVIGFQEKPAVAKTIIGDPNHCYASMGIYVFSRKSIEEQLIKDSTHKDSNHDFGKDIIPKMISQKCKVVAYNFRDENNKEAKYWRDIGSRDAYYEANMDLVGVSPIFSLYDKHWPIRTYQEQYPPAKFVFSKEDGPQPRVGAAFDSLVSNGCIVSGGRVERSVLSYNVRVNSFSLVQDSILFDNVDVGRHAKIKRAIIDKDVKIPENMEIGYDLAQDRKRFTVTTSGVVIVAKGTLL